MPPVKKKKLFPQFKGSQDLIPLAAKLSAATFLQCQKYEFSVNVIIH